MGRRPSQLLWTDIERSELWTLDSSGDSKVARAPERIGSFAPCESGGIVAAFASGFAFWDLQTGQRQDIEKFEAHLPTTRLNDGGTDRQGRFLAAEAPNGEGHFYDQEDFQGRSILDRNGFSDIKPDASRFEQAFSDDGGKNWETNWIMTFTR